LTLEFPEKRIANDEAWLGSRQAHGRQSFSSSSR
jgi:hypothetical protein